MKIGDLIMRVLADMRGFDTTVEKEAAKTGDKAGKAMSKSMNKSMKSQVKGGLLQGLGIGAGLGAADLVAKGVSAMTDEIFKSIDAASDLREAMSLSTQVFEDQQDGMEQWADGASKAFGQSRREALQFAAGFGTAFKNVGFTLDDTAERAKTMTRLAADLGSAFNASGEEAATALRSGLLGESEPLRRFGVFLSEAAVKAKAMQLGLGKAHKELTNGEKVAARYAIIMEQTADSQGMFGRDTDSLADAQKSLNAELEDVRAEIGEMLLPIMRDLAVALRDEVLPAVKDFIQTIKDNQWIFEFLGIAFDAATHPMDAWATGIRRAGSDAEKQVEKIREMARATDEARHSQRKAAPALEDVGGAYSDAGIAAGDAARDIETANRRVRTSIQKTRDVVMAVLTDLIDNYYGGIERQEELLATRQELAQLRRKESLGKLTDEEKTRMRELQQTMDETLVTMAEKGETANKTFRQGMDELLARQRTAHGAERKYVDELIVRLQYLIATANTGTRKLIKFTAAGDAITTADPKRTHRARGGHVEAGHEYYVNENTPMSETWRPSLSGTIYPDTAATPVAAGGQVVNNQNINIGRMDRQTMPDAIRELRRIDDVKRMRTTWG